MIKTLMVALYPIDPGKIKGGVEAVSVNLVNGFIPVKGIDLKVLSLNGEIKEDREKVIADHIKIHHIAFGKIKSIKYQLFFHFRKRIEQFIREYDPDVIHIQGNGSQLLLTYKLDIKKLVITQHGILKEELKNRSTLKSKLNSFVNMTIEFFLMSRIRNFVFISDYNFKLAKAEKARNTALIYNPVNPKFFSIDANHKPVNRLVYIGGIMKRKGLLDLLEAIKTLKERNIRFNLDVVGGVVEPEYAQLIDTFIEENALQGQVTLHSWLSQDQIVQLYKQVHVLVLPSYQETLPVCISEAMAAGRIVVATRIGGVPEMIEDRKSGFLYEKGNVPVLVEILSTIHLNEALYKCMSSHARDAAIRNYDAVNTAEETKKFYQRIVNEGNLGNVQASDSTQSILQRHILTN